MKMLDHSCEGYLKFFRTKKSKTLEGVIIMNEHDREFWKMLDEFFEKYDIEIDRPKGTAHPKYSDYIYPLDYGFLKGTVSSDGAGIDVWIGSSENKCASAIITSIDFIKGDSEIKILYACTSAEIRLIYNDHNRSVGMKGILTVRQ